MGDDEFFGSATARNPLILDELVSFGRQLLNIAFTLYWRGDQTSLQETNVSSQVRCTWEDVRDKVTKCLLDIHAREYVPFCSYPLREQKLTFSILFLSSRKPFVPPDQWLATSQLDMQSFIEAAMYVSSYLNNNELAYFFAASRNNKYKYPSLKPNLLVPSLNAKLPLCRPGLEYSIISPSPSPSTFVYLFSETLS
jgi:hypothetical protein